MSTEKNRVDDLHERIDAAKGVGYTDRTFRLHPTDGPVFAVGTVAGRLIVVHVEDDGLIAEQRDGRTGVWQAEPWG